VCRQEAFDLRSLRGLVSQAERAPQQIKAVSLLPGDLAISNRLGDGAPVKRLQLDEGGC